MKRCNFCPENFIAGVEMYGGLGDRYSFGLHDTSHYVAPVIAWNLPSDWTLRLSPGFGLNDNSHRFLLRWGVSREFSGIGAALGRLLGGQKPSNRRTRSGGVGRPGGGLIPVPLIAVISGCT